MTTETETRFNCFVFLVPFCGYSFFNCYAILTAEGFATVDEVVFAEPGDMTLLGVRTVEAFGVMVDNIAHRFVTTTTIVAVADKAR